MAKTPLVVQSKIKEAIKSRGFNTAGDVVDALTDVVETNIKSACKRAESNGRKTVRATDF